MERHVDFFFSKHNFCFEKYVVYCIHTFIMFRKCKHFNGMVRIIITLFVSCFRAKMKGFSPWPGRVSVYSFKTISKL